MSKLEMMEQLMPGLTADEIEVRIDQMEDIIEVLIKNDLLPDEGKLIYANATIRIKELLVQLLDAIGEGGNNEKE